MKEQRLNQHLGSPAANGTFAGRFNKRRYCTIILLLYLTFSYAYIAFLCRINIWGFVFVIPLYVQLVAIYYLADQRTLQKIGKSIYVSLTTLMWAILFPMPWYMNSIIWVVNSSIFIIGFYFIILSKNKDVQLKSNLDSDQGAGKEFCAHSPEENA